MEDCTDLDNFDSENTWQWDVSDLMEVKYYSSGKAKLFECFFFFFN